MSSVIPFIKAELSDEGFAAGVAAVDVAAFQDVILKVVGAHLQLTARDAETRAFGVKTRCFGGGDEEGEESWCEWELHFAMLWGEMLVVICWGFGSGVNLLHRVANSER